MNCSKGGKRMDLVKYGGIDGIIESIEAIRGSGESLYDNEFWGTVIKCLKDYKCLKNGNRNDNDAGWPDLPKIGDRHEMGG